MASEEELQRMAYEMNYYRAQADEMQRQLRTLQALAQENDGTQDALKELYANGEKGESMFSVGSGVFARAKPSARKVLMDVGARVITEKTFSEAIEILEARKEQLIKVLSAAQDSLQELNSKMLALGEKAEKMQRE